MATEGRGRPRRGPAARGRLALAAVAVAAAAAAVALADGSGGVSGPEPSARAGATGTVARRTLAERLTTTGTIGYAGETTVLARLSGTVTALPAVGDVIRRGRPLYAVAGEPVLLMYGSVPAYRTLADRVPDGKDIEQLKANLAALGYEPGAVDEEFTYTTTEAIIAWQEDLGLEVTGEVELGRVDFLPGPQRVTKLEATLGEALATGGSGGNASTASSVAAGAGGSTALVAWHPEAEAQAAVEEPSEGSQEAAEERERELEKQERELGHEREKLEREQEHAKERREREREKARAEKQPVSGSEAEPSSVPVLRTSSTRRVVSVELEADQQLIVHRGQQVQVILPGGAEVPGKVTGLAGVEASGGEGGQGEEEREAGVEATISLTGKHRIPALAGASVSVRFTQEVRKHVLSVPLTALIAIGGERFAVHVLQGGAQRQIVVVPGLAANGYVEVEGRSLKAGMRVETGE